VSSCRKQGCGAPLIWAEHYETGRRMPLNQPAAENPRGPGVFYVVAGKAYPRTAAAERVALQRGVSTSRAEQLLDETLDGHTSHFATCPAAGQFRRRKPENPDVRPVGRVDTQGEFL
jgi:hypothetical protein